jgi:hypothetical protein
MVHDKVLSEENKNPRFLRGFLIVRKRILKGVVNKNKRRED